MTDTLRGEGPSALEARYATQRGYHSRERSPSRREIFPARPSDRRCRLVAAGGRGDSVLVSALQTSMLGGASHEGSGCTPEASLAVAARLMREADYGTLPVVNTRGEVVGIVTDRDVCLALARTNRNAVNIAVREVMTTKVLSALLDDDVHRALATMKGARVRRLPVRGEFGRLKGMLSIEDVVLRGLQDGEVEPAEIVEALRTMYVRASVGVDTVGTGNGLTPG